MKKMRIENPEMREALTSIKEMFGYGFKFVSICIAIPARLMLAISGWMDGVAWKLTDRHDYSVTPVTRDDIVKEITDV